ncbi:gamma-glutamyltranspeptidase / glutathione hydrolase [Marinospirillum celere]|uniref:Glutathione hydrolase proenzyme n=1 Tax=Marinospirillum celere TaxID=1122252 RepID=A0A1I1ET40_9GAMM|nr:gamma-glutamyltransferase [Marinospirillum celere]SFB88070.1 gamma-glutamyltranspeptidase / glutathione hydrolase [Marinospirillum celere]
MTRKTPLALAFAALLIGCAGLSEDVSSPDPVELQQPEMATGLQEREGWVHENYAVAAANPLAAEAGKQILEQGGSAVDAAIAVQLVLGLVEPQSSGIGGGGFLLSWDGEHLIAWDGRETAPAGATPDLFLDAEGRPMNFMEAVASGGAVGVPGLLAMLEAAHKEQGELPWEQLFEPAIQLAEEGFPVSSRLHQMLAADPLLHSNPAARGFYFTQEGEALPEGHLLTNPALAAIYRQLAQEGSEAFYTGALAENLLENITRTEHLPSSMTLEDLAGYQPIAREALCASWLEQLVCGFPPPSSGQLAVMQILGILEVLNKPETANQENFYSPEGLHLYIEASRLAFADRAKYLADPDFVEAPGGDWSSLLQPDYLKSRAREIAPVARDEVRAGFPGNLISNLAPQPEQPEYGTSHISIIDSQGRGLAMTTSVEQAFGSRILVDGGTGLAGGYLLNNQLTDFSFRPEDDAGRPIANRVEPGKRPRSSMSPTLVFNPHSEELVASLGSPGGAAIIHYTAKTLLGMLQWQLSPQDAIQLPNIAAFDSRTLLEKGRFDDYLLVSLEARGQKVEERELTSGIQGLLVTPQGILGGADPRREGWVAGD